MRTITTTMIRAQVAVLISLLVLSVAIVFAAPQQVAQSANNQVQQQQQQQMSSTTLKPVGSSPAPPTGSQTTVASSMSTSPSLVNLRPAGNGIVAASSVASDKQQQQQQRQMSDFAMNAFDGRNPFADDSLWQMPVSLVRDLANNYELDRQQPGIGDKLQQSGGDRMAKAASNLQSGSRNNDYDDDDEQNDANEPNQDGKASNQMVAGQTSGAPTVISTNTDLKTAAGYHYPTHGGHHHHHHHEPAQHHGAASHHGDHYGGKYFQYASVPYPYAWDFGYRRGNPYHTIERYEHGKGPHFQTKVKWSDKHGGYGVHVWDYNHDDHHSHHYGSGHHEPSYGHHEPAAHHHYGAGHGDGYGHH